MNASAIKQPTNKWIPTRGLGLVLSLAAAAFIVFSAAGGDQVTYAAGSSGLYVFGARAGTALTSSYSAGSNPLIEWADLEPSEGKYDWSVLDKAINDARNAGRKLIPRVYTNTDGFAQASPDWFFRTSGAQYYYPSAGAQKSNFKAPVPWDPIFEAKFGRFLSALGQRYNGNPTIEFFQTNAGGGLYGEIILSVVDRLPPGYSNSAMRETHRYWADRWLEAFPDTQLSMMVNYIGGNVGEDAAAYAAGKGFYLQQNSPTLSAGSQNIFKAHQDTTRIVVEAEGGGCTKATGSGFDSMINTLFSYGFAVDYLTLCDGSFRDATTSQKLPEVAGRLRTASSTPPASISTPTPPAPTKTSTVRATSTPRAATATRTPTRTPTPTKTPVPASAPATGVRFADSFESGGAGWTASGLWHLTNNTSCISPSAASPVRAFYYGAESTCSYASGRTNKGTLTSPSITGVGGAATLSFSYWREVELNTRRSYDTATVQVSYNNGRNWTTVWSASSRTASERAWLPVSVNLKPSSTTVTVRFVFDTVNSSNNGYKGWLIDDVKLTNN